MTTSPKRAALVRAGRELFLRHGIRKTRVEEVCADASVSKRTFYRYFHDKDELAVAVLAEIFEAGRARIEAVFGLDRPIEERIRQLIQVKTDLASETSAAFYRDALDDSTVPGRFLLRQRREWDERVRRFYLDAQARELIRGDIDIDLIMALMVRLRELVDDADLAVVEPDLARRVDAVTRLFFYGILPRQTSTPNDETDRGRG